MIDRAYGKIALAAILLAWQALAHEAVTGWEYPLGCCSSSDCYHIEPDEVEWTQAGWRIRATGEVVPHKRVRQSPDWLFHRCSKGGEPARETLGKTYRSGTCFWAPAGGS